MLTGAQVAGASPAAATTKYGTRATPYNMTGHSWSYDGCTVVPSKGYWLGARFDFYHACIHHDGCYLRHWAGKLTCDYWFYIDMRASCAALHPTSLWRRAACRDLASRYYQGVVVFGLPFYLRHSIKAPMNAYL